MLEMCAKNRYLADIHDGLIKSSMILFYKPAAQNVLKP